MSGYRLLLAIIAIAGVVVGWLLLPGGDRAAEDAAQPATEVDTAMIGDAEIADESRTEDWLAYGRTHSENRFSPLTDVNRESISELGVAWYMDLPNDVGLVSTPLVVGGMLYFTGTMNIIRAVDATTGELVWGYDPDVAGHIGTDRQVGWVHNRGISFYGGRIFSATWDGVLLVVSISPAMGKLI